MTLRRPLALCALLLFIFAYAGVTFFPRAFMPQFDLDDKALVTLSGVIYRIDEYQYSCNVYLKRSVAGGKKAGRVILKVSGNKPDSLKIGNTLTCRATYSAFSPARNKGNFDELKYRRAMGTFFAFKLVRIQSNDGKIDHIAELLKNLKGRLIESLEDITEGSREGEAALGVLNAILTGDRNDLTGETKDIFKAAGIAHILAISGLHISMIGMGVYRILRRRLAYVYSAVVALAVVGCFCVMSGASPTSVRALIMFAVYLVAMGIGKTYDCVCALSLSCIILILDNPFIATYSGLHMSVAALAAFTYVGKPMAGLFLKNTAENENQKKAVIGPGGKGLLFALRKLRLSVRTVVNKLARWTNEEKRADRAGAALIMSASVALATLPIIAANYYEFSPYSPLVNMLVVPLVKYVLESDMAGAAAGIIRRGFGRLFIGAGVYLVRSIEWACTLTASLPYGRLITGAPKIWQIAVYYALLFICVQIASLMGIKSRVRKLTVCAVFLIMSVVLIIRPASKELTISFIDVDQGDSALIETAEGTKILIDCGSSGISSVYEYRLESTLKYRGISELDYVFVTHPERDHMSAVLEMLERPKSGISISCLILPRIEDNEKWQQLVSAAGTADCEVIDAFSGLKLADKDLKISCIHPEKGFYSDDVNSYSAVLSLEYGDFRALFMGDLPAEEEKKLVNKGSVHDSYDLLKVSHHGSRTSSCPELIDEVSPRIAIISAGIDNSYGHPHEEIVERIEDSGAEVYITAQCGEIDVEVNKKGIARVSTCL